MPIFKVNNSIILFIHVPKTGGTSVEKWLRSLGSIHCYTPIIPSFLKSTPQHLCYSHLKLILGDILEFDYTFSIVRNPYAKLESDYFYTTAPIFEKYGQRPDFSEWGIQQIKNYKKNKFHYDNHFRPQTDFIDRSLTLFKFEQGFDLIFNQLAIQLGVEPPQQPIHENKSNKKVHNQLSWSSELLNLFNKTYENDFVQLGYQKRTNQFFLK